MCYLKKVNYYVTRITCNALPPPLLIKVINYFWFNSNSGKTSVLVLLDLSAAFDTVDHNILLEKDWKTGSGFLGWCSNGSGHT